MEKNLEKEIDEVLQSIEFPGEDDNKITTYLIECDFTTHIMNVIEEKNNEKKKLLFWFVFTLLNIIILYLLGTNQFIKNEYFALHNSLATLFFLFLGVSLFCGLVGFIHYIDTSWFHEIHHLPDTIMDGINKAKKRLTGGR